MSCQGAQGRASMTPAGAVACIHLGKSMGRRGKSYTGFMMYEFHKISGDSRTALFSRAFSLCACWQLGSFSLSGTGRL